jgi:CRP-like cAMP-binding protein
MLTLREALGLGIDGMATIARLARVARARQFEPGAVVCEGDLPADVVIPLDGELVLQLPGGRKRTVRPGEVLGLVEAVAGVPVTERATAGTEVTALVLSHQELAEDIEDEYALCFELIRSFSAQLWAALSGAETAAQLPAAQVGGGS